ncbi:MAG: stage III sporulation protein AF [Vallitaleaceae bacterium]|nr:stage III sporulation protein AF [Vallitaleaceae bacterium]
MEFLINWAKNIIYYLLFVKLLISLIPTGNMTRYIKLFSGILLIIILIQPLLNLEKLNSDLFQNVIQVESEVDRESLTNQAATYENLNNQLAMDVYKKNTKKRIELIVKEENVAVTSLEIEVDEDVNSSTYGALTSITILLNKNIEAQTSGIHIDEITIGTEKDPFEPKSAQDIILEKNIKSRLIGFYNLPIDNIHISIENR